MSILRYVVTVFSGYIFGSVSFSVLISTLIHKADIRSGGSGNAGATNMARSFGLAAGLETLAGDMFKTLLALFCGYFILGSVGLGISGAACLLGHCWPVFYDFRGGKGVSAGAVIYLFISPILFIPSVAVFIIVALITRKVSPASLAAAIAFALFICLSPALIEFKLLAVFTALVIIFRHRDNIVRLIHNEEPDFKLPHRK